MFLFNLYSSHTSENNDRPRPKWDALPINLSARQQCAQVFPVATIRYEYLVAKNLSSNFKDCFINCVLVEQIMELCPVCKITGQLRFGAPGDENWIGLNNHCCPKPAPGAPMDWRPEFLSPAYKCPRTAFGWSSHGPILIWIRVYSVSRLLPFGTLYSRWSSTIGHSIPGFKRCLQTYLS